MGLDILVGYPEMRTDPNIQKAGLFLEEVHSARASQSLLTGATDIAGRPLR